MKIILNDENQPTIKIDRINQNYLIVAILNGAPRLLAKGFNQDFNDLTFFNLRDEFTNGNGVSFGDINTIKEMIQKAIEEGAKVEAFHQDNWKEALQWLIDNAE